MSAKGIIQVSLWGTRSHNIENEETEISTGLKHIQPQQPDAPIERACFKLWPCLGIT